MSETVIEKMDQFLVRAMMLLGFRRYHSASSEEGVMMREVLEAGIRRVNPGMEFVEAEAIVMELATSGEDYGWPEKFTRAFCAKINATYSVAAVNKPVLTGIEAPECKYCRKCGIASLTDGTKSIGVACVCERGRALYESWRAKNPKVFDLSKRPDWIEWLDATHAAQVEKSRSYTGNRQILDEIKERIASNVGEKAQKNGRNGENAVRALESGHLRRLA